MLRLPFIIFLLALSACGEKGKVTETKFVISGLTASTPIEFSSSSSFVTAYNPNLQLIIRQQLSSNAQTLTLPNGTWYFYVVHWNSPTIETATQVRCGLVKEALTGAPLSLNLTVTMPECVTNNFNAPQFTDGANLQPLKLNQCETFGLPSDNCTATPGTILSVKITFPNIQLSPVDAPAVSASSIGSDCIATGGDGEINLSSIFPSGSNIAPVPFTIRAFSDAVCGTATRSYTFRRGLLTADQGDLRVYDFTTTTRILVRDGALIPLHASLVLPAESSYRFNMNNFFSGGTPPYTFSITGSCGALSGPWYSSSGTSGGSCGMTATDALSNTATFSFATVQAAHHTIFTNTASITGKWGVLRPSTQQSMEFAPGTLEVVGPDLPRFHNTQPFGVTAADRYLIIEKNSTVNLLEVPANYMSGQWVKPATITVDPIGTTDISVSLPHFRISKIGAPDGSIYQILPDRGGNHVASVYLKQGTSRYAGLRLENLTGACTGLVVDLQNGATQEMNGCPLLNTGPGLHGSQYIGNGWWRVWVTRTFISGAGGGFGGVFKIYPAWNTTFSNVENITATGSIFSFIPQLEGADRPLFPMAVFNQQRGPELASMESSELANINTLASGEPLASGTFLLDWHSREPEPNKRLMSFCSGTTNLMDISIVGSGVDGRPRVSFGTPSVQSGTPQDISQASQNRIAFKLQSGAARLFKRDDATPVTQPTGMGTTTTPTNIILGADCAATPVIHNLGVRRFGYWTVSFEDVVLREMSNGAN